MSHSNKSASIPVLFDIVERGKYAPKENKIKPPPPPEVSEFRLGDIEPDSEAPTVLPELKKKDRDIVEFSLDDLEDDTGELPLVSAPLADTERSEFTLTEREEITQEMNIVTPEMLKDRQTSADDLVEEAMKELMPQLEALARETLYELTHSALNQDNTAQEDRESADEKQSD